MFKSTLTGDYVHYYSKDEAIDKESPDFDHAKWMETDNMDHLPVKDGCTLTKFTIKRLGPFDHQYLFDIGGTDGPSSMVTWAVALGIRSIEPLKVDGKDAELGTQIRNGRSVLSDEWLAWIMAIDDGDLAKEIGTRVIGGNASSPRD